MAYPLLFWMSISLVNSTDYIPIPPMDIEIDDATEAMIELFTRNDNITLEYNDTVLLLFTPKQSDLIEFYENNGEYIRESMNVHIVDNDRK